MWLATQFIVLLRQVLYVLAFKLPSLERLFLQLGGRIVRWLAARSLRFRRIDDILAILLLVEVVGLSVKVELLQSFLMPRRVFRNDFVKIPSRNLRQGNSGVGKRSDRSRLKLVTDHGAGRGVEVGLSQAELTHRTLVEHLHRGLVSRSVGLTRPEVLDGHIQRLPGLTHLHVVLVSFDESVCLGMERL